MKRRTAITAIPLAIAGITTAATRVVGIPASGSHAAVLTERELDYALKLITEASTSGISSSFIVFANHVSTLATAGDCETIRTIAEDLLDCLYDVHNHYGEDRAQWISEETGCFANAVDMDDESLPWKVREAAFEKADARHLRRKGGVA